MIFPQIINQKDRITPHNLNFRQAQSGASVQNLSLLFGLKNINGVKSSFLTFKQPAFPRKVAE